MKDSTWKVSGDDKKRHKNLLSVILYSMTKQLTYKGVDIMLRRMTSLSLDEMAERDGFLDQFEELSRRGYSFERILEKIESEYDYYSDEDSDWDYE